MKKIFKILIICLITCFTLTLSSCLFNNGSIDEVYGIYGINNLYYKSESNETTYYGQDFDYYLLILNKDYTCKIIYKMTDKPEEIAYTTFAVQYNDSEKPEKVTDIVINNFIDLRLSLMGIEGDPIIEKAEFSFHPVLENISYKSLYRVSIKDKSIVSEKFKYQFHKISDRTTEGAISRAMKKQIRNQSDRDGSKPDKEND